MWNYICEIYYSYVQTYRHCFTESWLLKTDQHMTGLSLALAGPQLPIRLSEWSSLLWIGIYPEWWAGFHSSSLPLSRISRWIVLSSFQDRIYPNPFPLSQPVSSPVFLLVQWRAPPSPQLLMAEKWSPFHPCFLHTHVHTVIKLGYFLPPSYFSNLSTSICRYCNFLKFPYLFSP